MTAPRPGSPGPQGPVETTTTGDNGTAAKPKRGGFLPFDSQNPYQRLLADHLQQHRCEVVPIPGWAQLNPQVAALDVVHVHWTPSLSPHPGKLLQRYRSLAHLRRLAKRGTSIVWTVHNLIPHDSRHPTLDRYFSRQVAACASSLIAHSPAARDEILRRLGQHLQPKVRTIPHGHYADAYPNRITRAEARRELALPDHETLVLFLGIIRPYKGVPELLDAWTSLDTTHATLLIAGRIPDLAQADAFRRRIAQTPKVRLNEGFVPDDRLQIYFNAADLVVFPYRNILSSGSVVLAMSFGKYCVAPRIGAVSDLLEGAGASLYSDGPDAMRSALEHALAQSGGLERLGLLNKHRADRWDWHSIAAATADAYRNQGYRPPEKWWRPD